MKLVRWGDAGAERAGLVDGAGIVRDLSGIVTDWSWQTLSSETLAQVAALDTDSLPPLPSDVRLGAPVFRPGKICLLYTSPSPRDGLLSRMPSSA